jgi:cell division protein FtsI (penicillin-binding protein 3)
MTWADVLVNSSNIGMIKAGERLSFGQMRDALVRFGFGRPTGLGLPGEAAGLVTSSAAWNKYTHTSVCFGHEVAVTPVQMARAFAAFARPGNLSGTLPTLRLTSPGPGDAVNHVLYRVLPADVALTTRRTMVDVVTNMERRMQEKGWRYDMFGKSGTAKISISGPPEGHVLPVWSNGYLQRQYVGSFVAGAPLEQPRLVIVVTIDDPGPEAVQGRLYFGSASAGPVARRVLERSLLYLGVPPTLPATESERGPGGEAPPTAGGRAQASGAREVAGR